ncbi:MAG: hypothetical protein HKN12_02345 [Gemmatimonadetes bacterium]|nr:hypothetical protein [Gemmatimonadota bacterium]
MRKSLLSPAIAVVMLAIAVASGCGTEPEIFSPNLPPNTRISAGPPEAQDTGYTVNLFWFGWDNDGFVSHYEIAWETPDEWIGPIFGNDSLFRVEVAETCCVEPIPDFGTPRDSVYEQYHTFFVRSVDNNGEVDETPAVRSFNSKTVAPHTNTDAQRFPFGPRDGSVWGTSVEFEWVSEDDDGTVVSYERALATQEQFNWDTDIPFTNKAFVQWLDTLTYVPVGPNQYKDSLIWEAAVEDSVVFPDLPDVDGTGARHLYLFAVRAVDDAGAVERIVERPRNATRFTVSSFLNGPRLTVTSNIAGTWRTGSPATVRQVFAGNGLRFTWRATPGPSGTAVAGYSYAVEDTTDWTPFSINSVEWPEQVDGDEEILWFPDPGPHSFFVRAIDQGGFISVLKAQLDVFSGPRFCKQEDQYMLIVLDTAPGSLEENGILPTGYADIEQGLVDYWFGDYSYQTFLTRGSNQVKVDVLNCATTTVWMVGAAIGDGDNNVLLQFHTQQPNPLPSYVASGGNLLLLGTGPVQTMRYFERVEESNPAQQAFPVVFSTTLTDSTLVPHWASTILGVSRVVESIGNTFGTGGVVNRLRVARSSVPGYPDLPFDPLTWPSGPSQRGFGYYDRGIIPLTGSNTEVIYKANDSDLAIGVRNLVAPGTFGNTVYLGFHPYFLERPAFKQLVNAVLTDFGETPTAP